MSEKYTRIEDVQPAPQGIATLAAVAAHSAVAGEAAIAAIASIATEAKAALSPGTLAAGSPAAAGSAGTARGGVAGKNDGCELVVLIVAEVQATSLGIAARTAIATGATIRGSSSRTAGTPLATCSTDGYTDAAEASTTTAATTAAPARASRGRIV